MKTILVTGANGFVGEHTLNALCNMQGVELIAACRDRTKLSHSFTGEVREGDIRDKDYLDQLLDGVDVLVNAMAWSSLWGHKADSDRLFLQPNLRLIDAFKRSGASKIVNISSTSVSAPYVNFRQGLSKTEHRKTFHFWPHLNNVVNIENYLQREITSDKAVINLRLGLFAGQHYALGLLPILVPRMKTHLVPWVEGGRTSMPIIDGRDIGQVMALAATNETLCGYESIDVVGTTVPQVRDVIEYLSEQYHLPKPHFSVPFSIAYPFAWFMEKLDKIVPWEPLIVRSIIHLLEETGATNQGAIEKLGYKPLYHWKESIQVQMKEMQLKQKNPMKMARPIA